MSKVNKGDAIETMFAEAQKLTYTIQTSTISEIKELVCIISKMYDSCLKASRVPLPEPEEHEEEDEEEEIPKVDVEIMRGYVKRVDEKNAMKREQEEKERQEEERQEEEQESKKSDAKANQIYTEPAKKILAERTEVFNFQHGIHYQRFFPQDDKNQEELIQQIKNAQNANEERKRKMKLHFQNHFLNSTRGQRVEKTNKNFIKDP